MPFAQGTTTYTRNGRRHTAYVRCTDVAVASVVVLTLADSATVVRFLRRRVRKVSGTMVTTAARWGRVSGFTANSLDELQADGAAALQESGTELYARLPEGKLYIVVAPNAGTDNVVDIEVVYEV